eukprot:GHVL01010415.1.p1 GENE.GHVL01010415.1~~GHVL01010415.1.p1  ORF type:complete len:1038 (+),score=180.08 GHVL01010415.1:374-3115(+)
MAEEGTHFSEEQVMTWFCGITQGLEHVHSKKILHRDVKPQNIFLTSDGQVKIGDFGISKVMSYTLAVATTNVGTPQYMAPEMCENRPYTFKSDVWALGCVLYEICTLKSAFEGDNFLSLVWNIAFNTHRPIPELYSDELRSLVEQCIKKNPHQRPGCSQILQNYYMRRFYEQTEDGQKINLLGSYPMGTLSPIPSRASSPLPSPPGSPRTNETKSALSIRVSRSGHSVTQGATSFEIDYEDIILAKFKQHIQQTNLTLEEYIANNLPDIIITDSDAYCITVGHMRKLADETLGISASEMEQLMHSLDVRKNNALSLSILQAALEYSNDDEFEELIDWLKDTLTSSPQSVRTNGKSLRELLTIFDVNQMGIVPLQFFNTCLHLAYPKLSQHELERVYQMAQKNSKGHVLVESFFDFFEQKHGRNHESPFCCGSTTASVTHQDDLQSQSDHPNPECLSPGSTVNEQPEGCHPMLDSEICQGAHMIDDGILSSIHDKSTVVNVTNGCRRGSVRFNETQPTTQEGSTTPSPMNSSSSTSPGTAVQAAITAAAQHDPDQKPHDSPKVVVVRSNRKRHTFSPMIQNCEKMKELRQQCAHATEDKSTSPAPGKSCWRINAQFDSLRNVQTLSHALQDERVMSCLALSGCSSDWRTRLSESREASDASADCALRVLRLSAVEMRSNPTYERQVAADRSTSLIEQIESQLANHRSAVDLLALEGLSSKWAGRYQAASCWYTNWLSSAIEWINRSLTALVDSSYENETCRQLLLFKEQVQRERAFIAAMEEGFVMREDFESARVFSELIGARKFWLGTLSQRLSSTDYDTMTALFDMDNKLFDNDATFDKLEWLQLCDNTVEILSRLLCDAMNLAENRAAASPTPQNIGPVVSSQEVIPKLPWTQQKNASPSPCWNQSRRCSA